MHQLTENIKILQKAVIFSSGKFLIFKRAGSSLTRAGKWDLPGGNSEWPQSSKSQQGLHCEDIVREIFEETGLVVDRSRFITPIFLDTYFDAIRQVYAVIVGWYIPLDKKPKIVLSSEHTEFAWILLKNFDQYDFGFAGDTNGFIRQIVFRSAQ